MVAPRGKLKPYEFEITKNRMDAKKGGTRHLKIFNENEEGEASQRDVGDHNKAESMNTRDLRKPMQKSVPANLVIKRWGQTDNKNNAKDKDKVRMASKNDASVIKQRKALVDISNINRYSLRVPTKAGLREVCAETDKVVSRQGNKSLGRIVSCQRFPIRKGLSNAVNSSRKAIHVKGKITAPMVEKHGCSSIKVNSGEFRVHSSNKKIMRKIPHALEGEKSLKCTDSSVKKNSRVVCHSLAIPVGKSMPSQKGFRCSLLRMPMENAPRVSLFSDKRKTETSGSAVSKSNLAVGTSRIVLGGMKGRRHSNSQSNLLNANIGRENSGTRFPLARQKAHVRVASRKSIGGIGDKTSKASVVFKSDKVPMFNTSDKVSSSKVMTRNQVVVKDGVQASSHESEVEELWPNGKEKQNVYATAAISGPKSSRRKSYTSSLMKVHQEVPLEKQRKPLAHYMIIQKDVTPKMRNILVNWLIEVHLSFDLMEETLFLTVQLLDRFLSTNVVKKEELQLVGITSLLLASKYEDYWHPKIKDLLAISACSYTRDQVLAMEKLILRKLMFRLNIPTPYVFMLRFLKAAQSDKQLKHLAFFLIELCLVDYEALQHDASLLCASAIYVARCTLHVEPVWTKLLCKHTHYEESQLRTCANMIWGLQKAASGGLLRVTFDKYMTKHRLCAASIPLIDMLP